MDAGTNEIENCYFMIYGIAPEFLTGVAFRKAKRFNAERQKIIKCPYCGRQLTAVDISTKIELYRYPRKAEVSCHEYKKCHICHKTVGIIFAGA